ncbi:MAG: hypothetical protein ABW217_05665 [Polyangiaceae bacterium]
MSGDRDDELRAALALLRSDPPDNGFEQRLSAQLAYEVGLRPLRAEPPARDFEQRLHERLMAEPQGPGLRLVGGAEGVAASTSSEIVGLTPGTPDQVAVAPLPSAAPELAAVAPSPAPAPRKRTRGAWLVAAIVLLAGGATASAQSGLFVGLAARVEHVVSSWSRSSATAERERAAPVERPERLVVKPSELPRPALPEVREEPRPEPVMVAPPSPTSAPVERLELSAEQRARASEASARRAPIERVRRDVAQATRERQSREARTALPRASAIAASRRDEGSRRAQIERVRIEPGALPVRRPSVERVRPGDVVREVTRERQSRERPELIIVRDGARRGATPEPPRRERSPQDLTRGERPRR